MGVYTSRRREAVVRRLSWKEIAQWGWAVGMLLVAIMVVGLLVVVLSVDIFVQAKAWWELFF